MTSRDQQPEELPGGEDRSAEHPDRMEPSEAYAGRWIARLGGRIVGQGGTPEQALNAARAARFKETPEISYLPNSTPLPYTEYMAMVRATLPDDLPVYVVGGALRDAMLKRAVHDIDFVLPQSPLLAAKMVADRLRVPYYPLDEDRETGRVILIDPAGQRIFLDFSLQRGPDLESDLRARDFTINAMAQDLRNPTALLDPLGGAEDLRLGQLRACSPASFEDDPLRILRGIRLAGALKFRILPDTLQKMRRSVPSLSKLSSERVRDELFRILEGPQTATCMRALDMLGALPMILPELKDLHGLVQPPPHTTDGWAHTLGVLDKLDSVLDALSEEYKPESAANVAAGALVFRLGRYRMQVSEYIKDELSVGRSRRGLLFLAALYHDAAKPQTSQVDEKGRLRFFGHDQLGAKLAARRARALHLSNPEIDWLSDVVRHHMRPVLLANEKNDVSRRAVYRFFRDTGGAGVAVCLLSLADVWATYGHELPLDSWKYHLDVVRQLLDAWWETPTESVSPPALLTGHDLIAELDVQAGPIVGEMLEAVREAQVEGLVKDHQQALDFARSLLDQQ